MTTLEIIQRHVGGCREWIDGEYRMCAAPSEYVLWGKLLPAEGLGPRCYEHAAKHVSHSALYRRSGWALIHLSELADSIDLPTTEGAV